MFTSRCSASGLQYKCELKRVWLPVNLVEKGADGTPFICDWDLSPRPIVLSHQLLHILRDALIVRFRICKRTALVVHEQADPTPGSTSSLDDVDVEILLEVGVAKHV